MPRETGHKRAGHYSTYNITTVQPQPVQTPLAMCGSTIHARNTMDFVFSRQVRGQRTGGRGDKSRQDQIGGWQNHPVCPQTQGHSLTRLRLLPHDHVRSQTWAIRLRAHLVKPVKRKPGIKPDEVWSYNTVGAGGSRTGKRHRQDPGQIPGKPHLEPLWHTARWRLARTGQRQGRHSRPRLQCDIA